MDKIVYLFELDSVRKYENPSAKAVLYTPGIKAVFSEIIKNGNSVAISMNQLTDSQFIRETIADDTAYHCLLKLFETGALRVCLYGTMRTASQYIQQAVERCLNQNDDSFEFSNLPVKSSDTDLLTEIRDALRYSDLAVLSEKVDKATGDEKQKLRMIYRFVNMVLQLSVCETSNIAPKRESHRTLEAFLNIVTGMLSQSDCFELSFRKRIENAIAIINQRSQSIHDGRQNRSNWLDPLAEEGSDEYLANEIIHICYNYTVEDSINGVTKHYDDNDFENTFRKDLFCRIHRYCCSGTIKTEMCMVSRAQWKTIIRFAEYRVDSMAVYRRASEGTVYEKEFRQERHRWLLFIFRKNIIALGMALMYIAVFCGVELGSTWIENNLPIKMDNIFVFSLFGVALFGIFGSLIDIALKYVNRGDEVPDILESLVDIVVHFCDFWRVLGGSNDSYRVP